ncbi:MAG: excinuclease ABC subunit UvrA [Thiomonas sp.]
MNDIASSFEPLASTQGEALIRVRGARTHNLKNISLDLPRNKLVVITGLSGSGKSSLAFDTLYAEGQRRYVESLSAYARQFLQLMEKPDVDLIEGLAPAIAIEQKATSHNPRSTVGTVTEIHDYLRLLYARAGTPHCPHHPDQPLQAQTISQMVDALSAWPAGRRLLILAPLPAAPTGTAARLAALRAQGFVRFRLDGEVVDAQSLPGADAPPPQRVEVVVDRIKTGPDLRQRLAESLETALCLSEGRVLALDADSGEVTAFHSRPTCPICGFAAPPLEPKMFSFNNPAGACPTCDGLGQVERFDPARVVAHPELSLASGAIRGWDRRNAFYFQMLQALGAHYGFDLDTPYEQLPQTVRHVLLHGSGAEAIAFTYLNDRNKPTVKQHPFEGILPNLDRRWAETDSPAVREELARLRTVQTCPECGGARLGAVARNVTVGGQRLQVLARRPLRALHDWFAALQLDGQRAEVAARLVHEIGSRLRFLLDVGLDYLTLDRSADTLSGGEAQRIRLASQIGSGLTGVMYVLDEPSIGLHQRDNDRLIATLKRLRDLGNSVLVVEHDADAILCADHVVDMGPGAGEHGGRIIAQGTPQQVMADPNSLTGAYLSGQRSVFRGKPRQHAAPEQWLTLSGACGNNLHNVTARFPLGRITCVAGVSGSGKSTLINDTLYAACARELNRAGLEAAPYAAIDGLEHLDKVIAVDQSPIGRTPRSNPATYTGLFTPIRELYAQTAIARERGYDAGRFSFNVKGGRCEACQGDGAVKVEMHFMPDLYVPCDVCGGQRYNRETLEVTYRGLSIAQALDLTVEQALDVFGAVPAIARKLQTLMDVGLGYIRLGQSAITLSGGEAQRVKLALELSKRDTGRTLYILDEPTTGLHFADIELLLGVLFKLRDAGNTIVVIEHNLDVLASADWIVELGPKGGAGGGLLIAEGTPEAIAAHPDSVTGPYLGRVLRGA